MKKIILPLLSLGLVLAAWYFNSDKSIDHPKPTEIHEGGEDGDSQNKRQEWFELMHSAAPGTNWRAIERTTQMERHEERVRAGHYGVDSRSGEIEDIAEGTLTGVWNERGSLNQAGSVMDTEYDVEADQIWLISAGGTLFRGERDGSNWDVINQDLRFSGGMLHFLEIEEGRRLIAPIERLPHYSDDDGITWTASTGININDSWGNIRHAVVLDDSLNTIYIMSKPDYWSDIRLYKSIDKGESYQVIQTFDTNSFSDFKICKPHHSNDALLITRGSETALYKINPETDQLDTLSINDQMLFGDTRSNLTGTMVDSVTILYTYTDQDEVYKTTDFGQNWTLQGTFDANPWSVGMYVSPSNPEALFLGEVDCFRSLNGGQTWTRVNHWWEYYDNVEHKLHADMMFFNEFQTAEGEDFLLVSNHGGLNISYNELISIDNLGLEGLNVGQYYSVKSPPDNPYQMWAGTQDQGLQMGLTFDVDIAPMDQINSGDYGHIVFTNNSKNMWTVYPGGAVSTRNTLWGSWIAGYDMESEDESVWLPPLMEGPDPLENYIYMAGGNINGGPGSHFVKLELNQFNEIIATQSDFDFKSNSGGGELSALEYSSLSPNKFYAATTNGRFFFSEDSGENWEQSLNFIPEGHYLYGQTIYASKVDTNTIYLGGSGYSNPAIYRSKNGGDFFLPFNTGLPSTLVFEITGNEDESLLFAATEAGPYVYIADEGQWFDLSGLCAPAQTYWSVEYLPFLNTVRFGTYGRGAWDFEIMDLVDVKEGLLSETAINVYPNPTVETLNIEANDLENGKVDIAIYDLTGKVVQSKTVEIFGGKLNTQLNVSSLISGSYFINIQTSNNSISKRFMKY